MVSELDRTGKQKVVENVGRDAACTGQLLGNWSINKE